MQVDKPKIQRVHVTVRDPDTRKAQCITHYGKTVADVIGLHVASGGKQMPQRRPGPRRKPTAPSAA